ncbi:MAG: HAD family hydrolase [Sphaerochaeta sp.]|jgi:putative hydrolase of the HAD superfamily|nr:HAD family hydrolase [Sphaerochaeta sp.]MCI2076565.1 HAD family hydrolase [Sphaerochaeta sp.]MCI2097720.1 HAD family hydrolase [Sphaerochaeta sp.]MCI2103845.1 HAD family hydrolase [Sphaerochaeta sp.]MCI2129020.1 HAD family hydrolase [Sphaerochaeta sp.]
MQPLIIFMDSGDTLVDESTEVRDRPGGVVRSCSLFPGATEAIRSLWRKGYCIELVADGLVSSFLNIYQQQGLTECFAAWTVSEAVGAEKPDPRMFRTAFRNLGLSEDAETKQRVVMVGNNVVRDIRGAKAFGIRSILARWSPRYDYTIHGEEERPNYVLDSIGGLVPLIDQITSLLLSDTSVS